MVERGDALNLPDFLQLYDAKIDEFFKLKTPKLSKRNRKVNPWITDGLITSINQKESYYRAWAKTKTKKNPKGDSAMHQKYKDYRRSLKHATSAAKQKYYGNKIIQNKGDMKKTWALINELRGKRKTESSHNFV